MSVFLLAAAVVFAVMTTTFAVALAIRDNSVVDIVYGLAFVLSCWIAMLFYGMGHPRPFLLLSLLTIWGLRLAVHLIYRKQGKEEDFRYRLWREAWGSSFVWRSFLQIFMLQGAVILIVSLPVLMSIESPGDPLGILDFLGALIWLIGFAFETAGDWQLMQFTKNPANKGRIIQSGLWRYTRHPNYFGEATLWWGMFLIALGIPYGWVAIVSPLLIDFLLLKVSGIPMLEAKYEGHAEFDLYRQRTNAFFPWIPKSEKKRDTSYE